MPISALIVDQKDNVATAVRRLESGENLDLIAGDKIVRITLAQSVPFGHKFAISHIRTGEPVIKYGETIGLATSNIAPGAYVHVHNVEGRKGRGDKI